MFKDCKTGGYNLEKTWVNQTRFLALVLLVAIAYSLATFHGEAIKKMGGKTLCLSEARIKSQSEKT
jgi:hypothetical protein